MILGEEDFWFLLHNLAHWEFEIFLMVLFDGVIGVVGVGLFKKWLKTHDAKKHAHEHCDDVHEQGELFDVNTPSRKYTYAPGWNERRYKRLGRKGY
jgi:hypothetical protein